MVITFILTTVANVTLLLQFKQMHKLDAFCSAGLVCIIYSAVTRLADMRPASTTSSALIVLLCMPLLYWFMTCGPSEKYV
jgi:hypothetical protein